MSTESEASAPAPEIVPPAVIDAVADAVDVVPDEQQPGSEASPEAARPNQPKRRQLMATQGRVAAGVDAAGVVAGGAPEATRPRRPKVRRPRLPRPSQGSLTRTNQHRATALRPTVRARDAGVGVAAARRGGQHSSRRPHGHRAPSTRATAQPIPKSPASMGRPGWRPSGSDDAKVAKQVGGVRRC